MRRKCALMVSRTPHENHHIAVAQGQQQQADRQDDTHAGVGLAPLGGGVRPQLRFAVLGVGFIVFDAFAERAAGAHDGPGRMFACAFDVAGFQVLALHGDAAIDQRIEAGLHGLQDGGGRVVAGKFDEDGLLLAGFVQRGVDAAPFFRCLGRFALGRVFQLPGQPQPCAHDLIVDPRQG